MRPPLVSCLFNSGIIEPEVLRKSPPPGPHREGVLEFVERETRNSTCQPDAAKYSIFRRSFDGLSIKEAANADSLIFFKH